MARKVRWGVIGVANIAVKKVIPGMQAGELSEVVAIASRTWDRARQANEHLRLPKAYGSYEELLADPDIDAVYNPLPNHSARTLVNQGRRGGEACALREAYCVVRFRNAAAD